MVIKPTLEWINLVGNWLCSFITNDRDAYWFLCLFCLR
ncbi:hypothetical protein AAUPMC_03714 [Pasteurella multocida subsp. multocida str. Anand1_cattle]|nr:hypothetical protein AAUPMC_03714 [Pasteurella multocida subsp. multocida str. Anand1_cattle]